MVFLPVVVFHKRRVLSVPYVNKNRPSDVKHIPFTCPLCAVHTEGKEKRKLYIVFWHINLQCFGKIEVQYNYYTTLVSNDLI